METEYDLEEPMLPLDERFRQAEQYTMDLDPPQDPRPMPVRRTPMICIGNCNICRMCGNSNNRD